MKAANPRVVVLAVWMVAAVLTIPLSLAVKLLGKSGGWLIVVVLFYGLLIVGIWIALGFLPLLIRKEFPSKLAWAWAGLVMTFIGFAVFHSNMPDFGDYGPVTVPAWWCGNEKAAVVTACVGLGISVVGHILWIVACVYYHVRSRPTPEML
ncbi:hypothetical protein ACKFRM_11040 [Corynebacterium sp. YSMAA1_1_D6]|uniref:hypothetical protein n=1 Tax=Corynebacterium sp. YSMAA1_1_D6 TaxID=3383589 RepID=UPI0038D1303A